MKNLIDFKRTIAHALLITGSAFLLTSCDQNRTNDSNTVAGDENLNNTTANDAIIVDNDDDNNFFTKAAEMQMEEIRLGQLAQQKGTTEQVKELGRIMETDHTQNLNELKNLAQSKSISLPASMPNNAENAYEKLNEKDANDFGKDYADMMVKHHEDAIKLFEDAAEDSEDAEVKAWASSKLPGLRTHLDHAKRVKDEVDRMGT